ncbi:ABC transporter substrate-binding protein [Nocardioides sp. Soil777]|uniref:ABC transporter substrate-binding protein n=1 Tax=Nocardioides sp. Soil777 TaxID=1736409 RepID=UPI001910D05D|nr:ABC transporter substrate-binding protein [Nocardioides sp. Soil777]
MEIPMNRASLRTTVAATTVGLAAALLTGCSTGSTSSDATASEPTATTSAEADAFPVTIEHAFGETTIEEEPTRVATLGWTDHDHALALGVVPVGATKITWGGNEAGSSDWFDAALDEAGAEAPVRYDDADGAPIDEVAQLEPDLILATNSGITEAEYAKLSKIAPVVAYPEFPWTTPWQTSLEMVGEALGRTDLAAEAEADAQAAIDAAKADYPELDGASLIYGYLTPVDLSTVGIYAPQDPRVALLRDFGMVDADAVAGAIKEGEFYGTVSAERSSELDSDVLLTWVEKPGDAQTFVDDNLLGQIPAIASGNFYAESDKEIAMASTNPTPLSIPVVIDTFLPKVAEAVTGS